MPQPLAVLNDEEMHWLNDLGLPNQRRWLNHRTLGDEHRRTFPSARTDSSISDCNTHSESFHAKIAKTQRRVNTSGAFASLRSLRLCVKKTSLLLTLRTTSRRRPARFQGWFAPSTSGRASLHIRHYARRVVNRPARACSSSGVAHRRCVVRRGSLLS